MTVTGGGSYRFSFSTDGAQWMDIGGHIEGVTSRPRVALTVGARRAGGEVRVGAGHCGKNEAEE